MPTLCRVPPSKPFCLFQGQITSITSQTFVEIVTTGNRIAMGIKNRDGLHPKEQPERGLSTVGRDFVRKMEDLRILVDVSHLSEAGFWDVAEIPAPPSSRMRSK